jgi:hypothetical protein
MPIHIGQLSADVVLRTDDLPLSRAQLDLIVEHVLRRLAECGRDEERSRRADAVHGSALGAALRAMGPQAGGGGRP